MEVHEEVNNAPKTQKQREGVQDCNKWRCAK